jgi:hypothetical protein
MDEERRIEWNDATGETLALLRQQTRLRPAMFANVQRRLRCCFLDSIVLIMCVTNHQHGKSLVFDPRSSFSDSQFAIPKY